MEEAKRASIDARVRGRRPAGRENSGGMMISSIWNDDMVWRYPGSNPATMPTPTPSKDITHT